VGKILVVNCGYKGHLLVISDIYPHLGLRQNITNIGYVSRAPTYVNKLISNIG
jgi:hypothetical protein